MAVDTLFLPISGPRGASSRYRVFQFLPVIAASGGTHAIHLPPISPGAGIRRWLKSIEEQRDIKEMAKAARTVFIQKRLLPESLIVSLAAIRPFLFDFDDAIFTTPRGNRTLITQRRVERRLVSALSNASLVMAGNQYLCDYARQHADQVIHLPTVVDTDRYPAKQFSDTKEIVIGWIGHSVNHPYLAELSGVLGYLAKRFKIRLLVVSDRDLAIPSVYTENRRWSEATEVSDILDMDVGIMPMSDDPWSRGKCGLKAIQYMAAGIPVVCAAVGANIEIVRNGVDGYCVNSDVTWKEGLAELCSNMELRQHMGRSGRERVRKDYSLRGAAQIFRDALSILVGQDKIPLSSI
jgi:glycosyltransferase involved in cell wall biosynthesis